MFFTSWHSLMRIALVGTAAYVGLVLLLRVSGKRTLTKMNMFDLVVTVALGSTLASALLSRNVTLADALTGFAVLIALQFVITWLSVRSPSFSRLVKAEPALLYHNGRFLGRAMRRERVVEAEVRAAVRAQGVAAMEEVQAVVLETDGTLTVIPGSGDTHATALTGVRGAAKETGTMTDGEAHGDRS